MPRLGFLDLRLRKGGGRVMPFSTPTSFQIRSLTHNVAIALNCQSMTWKQQDARPANVSKQTIATDTQAQN